MSLSLPSQSAVSLLEVVDCESQLSVALVMGFSVPFRIDRNSLWPFGPVDRPLLEAELQANPGCSLVEFFCSGLWRGECMCLE